MSTNRSSDFLSKVLYADAAVGVSFGVLAAAAAEPLARETGLPAGLLFWAGLALLPVAAFMAFVAARASSSAGAVWLVVGGNVAWSVASVWLVASGTLAPNALGQAFVFAQALVVLAFAAVEGVGALGQGGDAPAQRA
jgi:hypothetical protein